MAFNPMKRDAMGLFRLQEALPKIGVFHRLLLCVFPTSLEPSFNPMLVEGVHHVLGVRDDVNLARAFKHFKSGDNAQSSMRLLVVQSKPCESSFTCSFPEGSV